MHNSENRIDDLKFKKLYSPVQFFYCYHDSENERCSSLSFVFGRVAPAKARWCKGMANVTRSRAGPNPALDKI